MELESLRILRVRSANRIHALPELVTRRENRDCFGLMMKLEGTTTYRTESGEELLSDRTHVCLLPKGATYAWRTTGGECFGIDFDAEGQVPRPLVFSVKENEETIRLFLQLEQALLSGESLSQLKAVSCLYRVFLSILEKPARYAPKSKETLIAGGVEKMKSEYSRPDVTIAEFAREAGISEAYFRRIYREVYGVSPVSALIALRMKKAAELLQTDHNAVSAIAEAVGYPNIYHFSKAFKQYFGVAPSRYLEQR